MSEPAPINPARTGGVNQTIAVGLGAAVALLATGYLPPPPQFADGWTETSRGSLTVIFGALGSAVLTASALSRS